MRTPCLHNNVDFERNIFPIVPFISRSIRSIHSTYATWEYGFFINFRHFTSTCKFISFPLVYRWNGQVHKKFVMCELLILHYFSHCAHNIYDTQLGRREIAAPVSPSAVLSTGIRSLNKPQKSQFDQMFWRWLELEWKTHQTWHREGFRVIFEKNNNHNVCGKTRVLTLQPDPLVIKTFNTCSPASRRWQKCSRTWYYDNVLMSLNFHEFYNIICLL